MRIMKIAVLAAALAIAVSASGCERRQAKYSDALRVGTSEIPKTLMPYVSSHSSNIFTSNMIYDTLLGSISEPSEHTLPDGTEFVPADDENYFNFTDRLCGAEGAYPRKEGSRYGWIKFDPSEEQYQKQLKRKGIVKGKNETGEEISETDEEFRIRAEKAVPSAGWMEYRFRVREGYTWNDGVPFSADDIVFTFQYALKNSGALASIAYFLDSYFDAYNDNGDLVLILATNKISDIRTICSSVLILPEHIWSEIRKPAQEKNLDPVGTGPYTVSSEDYIDDSSLTMVWRDDYSSELTEELYGDNPVKKITLLCLQNEDVTLNAMNQGDIDVSLDNLSSGKVFTVADNSRYSKIKISESASEFVTTLALNVGKNGCFSPEKNKDSLIIRKALSLTIDQDELINDVLNGNGTRVGDGLVQEYYPHALRNADGSYSYHITDREEAVKLLDEAGYLPDQDGNRPLSFRIIASAGNETLVNAIGKQFKDNLGIDIIYESARSDYSEIIKQSNGADYDMIINTVTFAPDKLLMFDARFGVYPNGTSRVWNVTGTYDSELSELMWKMETASDISEQLEKAYDVQQKISELYTEIPLYCAANYSIYTELNYKGWVEMSQGSVLNDYSMRYLHR